MTRCDSYGLPVIGSFGTVGLASNASRLGTTSMTPYMRTQWPGNEQTKLCSPGFYGAVNLIVSDSSR